MGRERINAVTTSFFGRGSIGLLPGELKKRGYRRGLIVTDRFLFEHKAADRVGEQILAAGAEYAVFYLVQPNPTIQVVNDCIQAAKALEVDFLVAVGGGSAIDTAKAVSIVIANGGRVEDYEGVDLSARPGLPIVAVNTTAGTGSEVTSFYIVTNPATHSKMCIMDTNCMVSIAVNDVDFMMTMPPGLTASTGMDAMTHAIEAVLSVRATPFTDKDAMWAIRVILIPMGLPPDSSRRRSTSAFKSSFVSIPGNLEGLITSCPRGLLRMAAISGVTLLSGRWPPIPGLVPWPILISMASARRRFSGVAL